MQRVGTRCPVSEKIQFFFLALLFEIEAAFYFTLESPLKMTLGLRLTKIDKQ
jgi:hypothetical protein